MAVGSSPALDERIERLNIAAALHGFDRALVRSGKGSVGWGILSGAVGMFSIMSGRFGWVNLGLGLLLIGAGLYEMYCREPKVIIVCASTLGFLALWNLASFALGLFLHSRHLASPVVGILLGIGAWNAYRSYALYAALLAKSDPGATAELASLLEQTKAADSRLDPDVVEFERKDATDPLEIWKLKRFDGLFLATSRKEILGRRKPTGVCLIARRQELTIEILGELRFGQKQKATLRFAGSELRNVRILPEMAQKLQTLIG
jgi:hypothetical protein